MSAAGDDWRPTAPPEALRARARLLAEIRTFFAERDVMEVETPVLGAATVPDPELDFLRIETSQRHEPRWLQSSPELAMKRLLAAGCGPIYQITRAFRGNESGRLHNPEFTILEWYRPNWDHHRLMDEVDELVQRVLGRPPAERRSYAQIFGPLAVDPHGADLETLRRVADREGLADGLDLADTDAWLDLLLSHRLAPQLGRVRPLFVHDYPASQAALAKTRVDRGIEVAERFELWIEGIEVANGFHELTDADEQRRRFDSERALRRNRGLAIPALDERFLAALGSGLPSCAGVALGVDRLLMLRLGATRIEDVLAFPWHQA